MRRLLSVEDGKNLVENARTAIASHLAGNLSVETLSPSSRLNDRGGIFVTLLENRRNQGLRGCIGNPFPKTSLFEETTHCAVESAIGDPRFQPVSKEEFERGIVVEVTVLSELEQIVVKSPLDLPLNVQVGRDGLLVEGLGGRGLLLPQVAVDEGFDEEEFLNECCLKAGLSPDAWVTGSVKVARFQGQIFSEEKPRGRIVERPLKRRGREE